MLSLLRDEFISPSQSAEARWAGAR